MSRRDELLSCFKEINVQPSTDVLIKCEELCYTYSLSPEDLIDHWFAYTVSHLNGDPPTVDALEQMERKEMRNIQRSKLDTSVNQTPKKLPKINDSVNLSESYQKRDDKGNVQHSYGQSINQFKGGESIDLTISFMKQVGKIQYNYQKLSSMATALDCMTEAISRAICHHQGVTLSRVSAKLNIGSQLTIAGRIYSKIPNEKITPQSTILETTLILNDGCRLKLSLDNLTHYALFPGQIVVVEGHNLMDKFVVEKLYTDCPLKMSKEIDFNLNECLQIVVAAGPFTFPDNLLFEPLKDLINYAKENVPNILILIGPFLETNHKCLSTADETFEAIFQNVVNHLMNELEKLHIRIVLIPSHNDVNSHVLVPTCPYSLELIHPYLKLASNPCQMDVNGLVIGAISADILMHISKNELSLDRRNKTQDRMGRLVGHLLNQRNFYPLFPPDNEVNIDVCLLEKCGLMDIAPNILIVPSKLRNFIKNINNTIVINPEKLCRANVGGTFARIEVCPGSGPVWERTAVEIIRI